MATITASLERSLQNCSLNQGSTQRSGGGLSRSSPADSAANNNRHDPYNNNQKSRNDEGVTHSNASSSDDNSTFVELNSNVSLPYHWEQCLDLKTGELYYINWSTGVKAREDPRTTGYNGDYYTEEEEDNNDDDEDDESSPYDSEGSSTEFSSCSSNRESYRSSVKKGVPRSGRQQQLSQEAVLVVAGCKSCFMYYMVPKLVEECPKCSGQLLHFAAN